jgi:hypothetical protein
VRDYNGIDGCASVRGSLCRVDAHEEWGRRNAPSGRCSHAPANDVAASTGLQHSIDRRPADLVGLRDLGSPEPQPSSRAPGRRLSKPVGIRGGFGTLLRAQMLGPIRNIGSCLRPTRLYTRRRYVFDPNRNGRSHRRRAGCRRQLRVIRTFQGPPGKWLLFRNSVIEQCRPCRRMATV